MQPHDAALAFDWAWAYPIRWGAAARVSTMSITPGEVQMILRAADRNAETSELPACAAGGELGPYVDSPRRVIGVRAKEKATTYAKWVGLMPVSPAGEGWSNTLAVMAVAVRCQLGVDTAELGSAMEVNRPESAHQVARNHDQARQH